MLVDVPDLRRHEVEIIEEPFCGEGDRLPGPDIFRERAVGVPQDAGVVIEPGKDVAGTAPWARVDGEARREGERTLFEPLDTEELVAKRFLRRWRRGVPQLSEESAQEIKRRQTRAGRAVAIVSACGMRPPGDCFGEG